MIEVGCWAHVRRKFFELHVASKSALAQTAVERIGQLYGIEREIVELKLDLEQARAHRQQRAKPLLGALARLAAGAASDADRRHGQRQGF